jgi:hypothetical protein
VPIARYFMVIGSALMLLLLIAGRSLPELPPRVFNRPEITERVTIRIKSEHKWPEKAVLDTNQPTFSSLPIEVVPYQQSVRPLSDEMTDQTSADVLAQQSPDVPRVVVRRALLPAKRRTKRPLSAYATRMRNRNEQPLGLGQECCRFEWESTPAMSKAASRRRVAGRDTWTGWHFPEEN